MRIFKDPAPTPRPSHTTSIGPHAGSSYNWPPRAPEQLRPVPRARPLENMKSSTLHFPTLACSPIRASKVCDGRRWSPIPLSSVSSRSPPSQWTAPHPSVIGLRSTQVLSTEYSLARVAQSLVSPIPRRTSTYGSSTPPISWGLNNTTTRSRSRFAISARRQCKTHNDNHRAPVPRRHNEEGADKHRANSDKHRTRPITIYVPGTGERSQLDKPARFLSLRGV